MKPTPKERKALRNLGIQDGDEEAMAPEAVVMLGQAIIGAAPCTADWEIRRRIEAVSYGQIMELCAGLTDLATQTLR